MNGAAQTLNPGTEKARCSPLRILYVMLSWQNISYHQSTIKELCNNGHQVMALFDRKYCDDPRVTEIPVQIFSAETKGFAYDYLIPRGDLWKLPLFGMREIRNYSRYLRFHDQSSFYVKRVEKRFPVPVSAICKTKVMQRILVTDWLQHAFEWYENKTPPYREIIRWVSTNGPDVIVASPANHWWSEEIEYIKAGNALRIPTVIPVLSWDNLTTKGLFHVMPDLTLAWNSVQRDEAMRLHHIPPDKVIITGAPFFDKWLLPKLQSADHRSFCKKLGIDPVKPFVVYLGSSANIAKDESWVVEELANVLQNTSAKHLRGMTVVVRPHPANATIYEKLSAPNIVVWPRKGSLPDTPDNFQEFHDTLRHSVCAIGLNTSGMIDAIIFGRPCITIQLDEYESTQSQALHFQYVMDADVWERARDIKECVELISRIASGVDSKWDKRVQFVKEFIRPRGVNLPAGKVAARVIEMAGLGKSNEEINGAMGV